LRIDRENLYFLSVKEIEGVVELLFECSSLRRMIIQRALLSLILDCSGSILTMTSTVWLLLGKWLN